MLLIVSATLAKTYWSSKRKAQQGVLRGFVAGVPLPGILHRGVPSQRLTVLLDYISNGDIHDLQDCRFQNQCFPKRETNTTITATNCPNRMCGVERIHDVLLGFTSSNELQRVRQPTIDCPEHEKDGCVRLLKHRAPYRRLTPILYLLGLRKLLRR